jgi:RNase P/RNase MRP subunit p29
MSRELIGKRIRLVRMNDEPNPVESGTLGTIVHIGADVINVEWDNGRRLGVIVDHDEYEILESEGGPHPEN